MLLLSQGWRRIHTQAFIGDQWFILKLKQERHGKAWTKTEHRTENNRSRMNMVMDMNQSNKLTQTKARLRRFKHQCSGTHKNFKIEKETQDTTSSPNMYVYVIHMCLDWFLIGDSTKDTGEKQKKRKWIVRTLRGASKKEDWNIH